MLGCVVLVVVYFVGLVTCCVWFGCCDAGGWCDAVAGWWRCRCDVWLLMVGFKLWLVRCCDCGLVRTFGVWWPYVLRCLVLIGCPVDCLLLGLALLGFFWFC